MRETVKYSVLVFLFFLIRADICRPISIEVTGDWSETINALDLQAGAGSDLISSYQSAADVATIDITGTTGNWDVDVKKVDSNWHGNFNLYVQRTSDGSGPGTIAGGTSYQEVTDTDAMFFWGQRTRANIELQLQLTGVSVQVAPDTYATAVYYTITEN